MTPHPDRTEAGEVILKAIGEGSSLTLMGVQAANGRRFRVVRDESTMLDLLDEEDRAGLEFQSESEWVDTFRDALALLDEYRWHMMSARLVHPDFRQQIWGAVQARAGREGREDKWARRQLSQWQRACHGEAD